MSKTKKLYAVYSISMYFQGWYSIHKVSLRNVESVVICIGIYFMQVRWDVCSHLFSQSSKGSQFISSIKHPCALAPEHCQVATYGNIWQHWSYARRRLRVAVRVGQWKKSVQLPPRKNVPLRTVVNWIASFTPGRANEDVQDTWAACHQWN